MLIWWIQSVQMLKIELITSSEATLVDKGGVK